MRNTMVIAALGVAVSTSALAQATSTANDTVGATSAVPVCASSAPGRPLRTVAVGTVGSLKEIASNNLNGAVPLSTLPGAGPLWAIGMQHGLDHELLVEKDRISTGTFGEAKHYTAATPADVSAAFLVYARIADWCAVAVPSDVRDFKTLEAFVGEAAARAGLDPEKPIPVRLQARVRKLVWFVVGGMGDLTPDPRASFGRGLARGNLDDVAIEAAGFYVRHQRGVLTNPVSDMHVHFRTTSGPTFIGHLDDEIALEPGATLFLPAPTESAAR